jgi:hypothetical protein
MKDLIVLAGIVASAVAPVSSAGPGEWTCHHAKDGSSLLAVSSKESNGTLLVRCAEGKPSISLKWGMAGGSASTLVSTRLDQREPTRSWWPRSVGRKEVQFAGDQLAYLRALRGGKTLAVRLPPDAVPAADARSSGIDDETWRNAMPPTVDVPLSMTFELTGLGAAISEAQGSCGTK